ncbi:MAG: glycerol kinase GlpK [Anaerolineales bacterium]|nr:glycerol kinase GlpK [Anaerolineales bacterium]
MSVILGIDQSTSATKALLFTSEGVLIDSVSLSHEQIYLRPGWVEHDPDEIYHNTVSAVGALLDAHPDRVDDLLCMSITNQRETIVVFDAESGKPLHNAIVWQCRRGEAICAELRSTGHEEMVHQRTGLTLDTYFSASKLRWLSENVPELQDKLNRREALIGTIDTYLIYRLTGQTVFATDHTNACRTLLFNIETLMWDDDLCELFDVPIGALPEVRESKARFGTTDIEGTLPKSLPICGVMGDSQAALFAQRCFGAGSGKVTFGTGSSVLLNIGSDFRLSDQGIVTTIGWAQNGTPTYAFEGITNFTGATITWLCNQLQLIDTPEESEALATSVPDTGGVYLVPAFVGLGAPYWEPKVRGAILGLTPSATQAHIVRAALEGIAYRIRDVLDLMAAEADLPLQVIHADGGAVGNRFLMQFVADMLGITVRASNLPELSALGAVFSGLLGTGEVHNLNSLGQLSRESVDYAPKMDHELVSKYYQGWQEAVHQILHHPQQS